MRYLGIDYGTKKIGLALSDKSGSLAFPFKVTLWTYDVHNVIKAVCEEKSIGTIILGRPEGYKGDAQKITKEIEKFKILLEKEIKLPVVYENEVLTTAQAGRAGGPHKNIDASSAALILQGYLDRKKVL